MTRDEFPEILVSEFPEIEEDVRDNQDLSHMQMGDFGRMMQRAIDGSDWPKLKRCVHLAQRIWQEGEPYLRNALSVSCLEHLTFTGKTGGTAFGMLTRDLREEWEKLDRWWAGIVAQSPGKHSRK